MKKIILILAFLSSLPAFADVSLDLRVTRLEERVTQIETAPRAWTCEGWCSLYGGWQYVVGDATTPGLAMQMVFEKCRSIGSSRVFTADKTIEASIKNSCIRN